MVSLIDALHMLMIFTLSRLSTSAKFNHHKIHFYNTIIPHPGHNLLFGFNSQIFHAQTRTLFKSQALLLVFFVSSNNWCYVQICDLTTRQSWTLVLCPCLTLQQVFKVCKWFCQQSITLSESCECSNTNMYLISGNECNEIHVLVAGVGSKF